MKKILDCIRERSESRFRCQRNNKFINVKQSESQSTSLDQAQVFPIKCPRHPIST